MQAVNEMLDATLACEDNLAFMAGLADSSMKLVVTSPPYNVGKSYEKRTSLPKYILAQRKVIAECVRLLAPNGSLCIGIEKSIEYVEMATQRLGKISSKRGKLF